MKRFLPCLSLAVVVTAYAQDSRQVESHQVASQTHQSEQSDSVQEQAKVWGLNRQEWQRYEELMRGPRGLYSPGLDPISVLGIEARSEEERQHFAELQARAEAARVQKELAYQRAYDEAAKRLHQGTQVVSLMPDRPLRPMFSTTSKPTAEGDGRLALFVKAGCKACDTRAAALQKAGQSFDIYMVDSQNADDTIRQWARRAGIDPVKVRNRIITLNHDAGRWKALGFSTELPVALRRAKGQWQWERL